MGAGVAVALCTAASIWSVARKETYPLRLMQKLEKAVAEGKKHGRGAQAALEGKEVPLSRGKQRLNSLLSKVCWAQSNCLWLPATGYNLYPQNAEREHCASSRISIVTLVWHM